MPTVQIRNFSQFSHTCVSCNSATDLKENQLNGQTFYICNRCTNLINDYKTVIKFSSGQIAVVVLGFIAFVLPGIILLIIFNNKSKQRGNEFKTTNPGPIYDKTLIQFTGTNSIVSNFFFANPAYASDFASLNDGTIVSESAVHLSPPSSQEDVYRLRYEDYIDLYNSGKLSKPLFLKELHNLRQELVIYKREGSARYNQNAATSQFFVSATDRKTKQYMRMNRDMERMKRVNFSNKVMAIENAIDRTILEVKD